MSEESANELPPIREHLILLLIKSEATSEEIGHALEIDSSVVRKMFPMRKTKKSKGG